MLILQRFLDRKSLQSLSTGAVTCAAFGSFTLGCIFWAQRVSVLVAAAVLAGVAWLGYWACKFALERGLAADRWDDEVRSRANGSMGRIVLWLTALWLMILIVDTVRFWGLHHRHATALLWLPIWLFSRAATTITVMVRPTLPPREHVNIFASMEPIRSEHWGERAS